MSKAELAHIFFKGRSATGDEAERVEAKLEQALAQGKEAWPQVEVPAAVFVEHLGRHCKSADPLAELAQLHTTDLYLACAALQRDAAALEGLELTVFSRAGQTLRRIDPSPSFQAEAVQVLRQRMLLGSEGGGPKLADYAGRGPLAGWVRAALVRTALNLKRGITPELVDSADELERLIPLAPDPELAYLRERYDGEFRDSFRLALKGLSPRDRNVLRLHLAGRLTFEQIARLYQVNRSSVSRWVDAAGQQLLRDTRSALAVRLRLGHSELDSLMRVLTDDLNVSLASFLRTTESLDGSPPGKKGV